MSQVLVDPARLVAEGDVLWGIGHRVESAVHACEAALAGTSGLAGDEDTARVFAYGDGSLGYDGAGTQVLQSALESVNALRSMDAALANTARAYDAARLVGAYRDPCASIYRAAEPQLVPTSVTVPTAVGPGPTTPLGEFAEFVQDALAAIGVVLPDADPGKIDTAHQAWADLAASLRRHRGEVDTSLHVAVSAGVPQHARIAACRDGIARRLDETATAADSIAGYVRALGDAVGKAWEEIGWLLAQMAAEIVLELGVGVLLSVVTAGVGAAATAAKITFTVARWVIRIAEVCHRLTTLIRGALTAARLTSRTAAHLVKDTIASGVAGVVSQLGYNELRAAVDPTYQRQGLGDIAAGGLIAGGVGGAGGVAKNVPGAKAGAEVAEEVSAPARHPLDVGFGKHEPSVITFDGVEYPKTAASNGRTTNVYDTSAIADADLKRHVWVHAERMAGDATLEQKAPTVWTAVMPDGTHVTARQISTAHITGSTDRARWTIEMINVDFAINRKRELKFR